MLVFMGSAGDHSVACGLLTAPTAANGKVGRGSELSLGCSKGTISDYEGSCLKISSNPVCLLLASTQSSRHWKLEFLQSMNLCVGEETHTL